MREKIMKIFVQSAAFLAVLLGSGLSQAATTTASIPMGVEVPKSCTFSNVSTGIVVPEGTVHEIGGVVGKVAAVYLP